MVLADEEIKREHEEKAEDKQKNNPELVDMVGMEVVILIR